MSIAEDFQSSDDLHPIDVVETLAEHHAWEFDRVTDDQIAMAVEGQWRTYSLTLAWSAPDETLRLICTFEMEPPDGKMAALYDLLNRCNDMVWTGAFTYWTEQKLIFKKANNVSDNSGDSDASILQHVNFVLPLNEYRSPSKLRRI